MPNGSSSRQPASIVAGRYAVALNKKFSRLGYRVGVQSGRVLDRLVLQHLDIPTSPLEVHGWISRRTGDLSPANNPLDFDSPLRDRTSRAPVVRYRLGNLEDFAAAVGDADPYAQYLALARLPLDIPWDLDSLAEMDLRHLRLRLEAAESVVEALKLEIDLRASDVRHPSPHLS